MHKNFENFRPLKRLNGNRKSWLVLVLTVQSDDRNHCYPEKGARPVGGVDHGQDDGHYEDNHHRNDAPNNSRGQIAAAEERTI